MNKWIVLIFWNFKTKSCSCQNICFLVVNMILTSLWNQRTINDDSNRHTSKPSFILTESHFIILKSLQGYIKSPTLIVPWVQAQRIKNIIKYFLCISGQTKSENSLKQVLKTTFPKQWWWWWWPTTTTTFHPSQFYRNKVVLYLWLEVPVFVCAIFHVSESCEIVVADDCCLQTNKQMTWRYFHVLTPTLACTCGRRRMLWITVNGNQNILASVYMILHSLTVYFPDFILFDFFVVELLCVKQSIKSSGHLWWSSWRSSLLLLVFLFAL